MRLINADDLIERINVVIEHGLADPDGLHPVSAEVVLETINVIPTATPEPHWIPCSERLPEENQEVLIQLDKEITMGWIYPDNEEWAIYEGEMTAEVYEVKAWMPLPEPFKGVTE